MDKAKAAVSDFLHKSGKHDTTVHESVSPAVQHETVQNQRHEEVTTALDREVHQDHYHTSVQPIQDREVLPEQHHHNLAAVEHRKHDHDDPSLNKERLEAEQAKFQNTTTTAATQHSNSVAPSLAGEHVHHHVHENIQPVIDKETVQPHVVHTTVPIHEVHQNAAKHHGTTELPAMTLDQYKTKGGSLSGRGDRYDAFEGEPKAISGLNSSHSKTDSGYTGVGDSTTSTGGLGGTTASSTSGVNNGLHSGTTSSTTGGVGGTSATGTSTSGTKPGLVSKLNPSVDADGDGKRGIMD